MKILCFGVILLNTVQLTWAAVTANPSPYDIQSQCKGMRPVYDDQGNLKGYNGSCNVNKWDGSFPSVNSLHPIDPALLTLPPEQLPIQADNVLHSSSNRKMKYKQPKNLSLFDWLSPHHDIIRNHPHYRHAHLSHNHCIEKAKTGLFDFLNSIFNSDSGPSKSKYTKEGSDPYSSLDSKARCLKDHYYANNHMNIGQKYFDTYAIHLGHQISNLQRQFNDTDPRNMKSLRKNLRIRYNQLHRHLDCHCHHGLPMSKMLNVHNYPIEDHSIDILAQRTPDPDINAPLQLHSSIPLDPSMDMENEYMTLMRMSNLAAQHAHKMNYFNEDSSDIGALRMEMFHPVNPYTTSFNSSINDSSDWNRLKVERVIVIKRIKIPVVTKVSVPVPVPVPYPIPSGDASQANANLSQYSQSQLSETQPGYIGNNTYMVDAADSQPEQMNSIVRAISGFPCVSPGYSSAVPYNYQSQNYNFPQSYGNPYCDAMAHTSNSAMLTHNMIQPGIQLYPSPSLSPYDSIRSQCRNQYTQPKNLQIPNLNSQFPAQITSFSSNPPQFVPPVPQQSMAPQNQLQPTTANYSNYKY